MKKEYFFSVAMAGFESVSGILLRSTSYSVEVEAVKIFMERNAIEREEESTMEELIRYYSPTVRLATKSDRASI